ncbi:MAG: tRNA (adenosine(37)-N6)-threonylcarbamoyltransferase complex transferase subunit TsaD, partial [Chloroflexota bacterium]|nr:tRNA (adenosine(37)-N6)-threonylcarbamoyltransferase complex transferase subunit TsaD [Chloroflexota bacterium]
AVLRIAQGGAAGPVGNPSRPQGVSAGVADRPVIALTETEAALLAAAFQAAVVDVLVGKTCQAAEAHRVRQIALAGGVAANRRLREVMAARAPVPVLVPDLRYCTDNAAMIAAAGYFRLEAGDIAGWDLDVSPSLRLA